jgi:LuxR family transcriptional regulator, quorum-sensing system regulator LasR
MFRMLHLAEMVGIAPLINRSHIPAFVAPLVVARTGSRLVEAMNGIVGKIGFDSFAYGALLHTETGEAEVVGVMSASPEWVTRYGQMKYFETDPRVQHCQYHATPFLWERPKGCGPREEAFLQDAAEHGIRSGIAVPLRSATGENAMFALDSSQERLPREEAIQVAVGRAYLLASYFHEWFFHNLRKRVTFSDTDQSEVSKRELEVLALASRGMSSKRIARQLGISESTANYHIASVKRKFRVRTRSQAVARAVHAGLIR